MANNHLNASIFNHSFLIKYLLEAYRILSDTYEDLVKLNNRHLQYNENSLRNEIVKFAQRKPKNFSFRWGTERTDLQNDNVRIDISIIYSLDFDYDDEDIFIECKIINNKNVANYINKNGIISYAKCKYSKKLPLAGMIAFVTEGTVSQHIIKLNNKLKSHKSIKTNIYITPYKSFKYHFRSNHDRTKNVSSIDLYHLMFDYVKLV
jgi:hypothetical protein